jgi:hypothetical protein
MSETKTPKIFSEADTALLRALGFSTSDNPIAIAVGEMRVELRPSSDSDFTLEITLPGGAEIIGDLKVQAIGEDQNHDNARIVADWLQLRKTAG